MSSLCFILYYVLMVWRYVYCRYIHTMIHCVHGKDPRDSEAHDPLLRQTFRENLDKMT